MIDNIDEKLRQAQIAKDKDDMVKHAEKTRQAAINLMKVNKVSETPEIKANGHKVKFLDPDNLKMVVDGKVFIGKEEIDSEINRIDLIGPDMKKVRDKERIKDITKKEIKNITSVGKVSAVRGVVSVPIRSAASGQHTMGALLHGLWALMQKAMQR